MKIKIKFYALLITAISLKSKAAHSQEITISNSQYHLYGPNSTWGAYLQVGGNGPVTDHAFVAATNGNLHLDSKAGFGTYINHYHQGNTYINPLGGKIGIGTFTIPELLNVNGTVQIERLRLGNAVFSNNSRNSLNSFNTGQDASLHEGWIAADFGGSDNASDRLVMGTGYGGRAVIGTHNYNLTQWGGDLLINPVSAGNVAIGTTSARERLSVNGKIRAVEIKVEAGNWPDYVFKPEYDIMPLDTLEAFIKLKGHLPEMPTVAQVEKEGIALGEINTLLLKKVEELTLHLIEENKKASMRDKEIDDLKEIIKQQQNRLKTIETKLNN